MQRLDGKRALVTGAASEIGSAIVRAFVEQGAMVVAVDQDEEEVEKAVASLGLDDPDDVVARDLDATDLASWWDLANFAGSYFHALDVFVHFGGARGEAAAPKTTRDLSMQELDGAQSLGARSLSIAVNRLHEYLRNAANDTEDGASVIVVSPPCGEAGPDLPQSAARAALDGMVASMAREFRSEGSKIRVNAIHPGCGDRVADARAVAAAVLYLASEESHFMTGQALILDGGAALAPR